MRICLDVDGTICYTRTADQSYADVEPLPGAAERIRIWKGEGHYIIIQTARHMVTCHGNEGKVFVMGAKLLIDWLAKYDIPYDELYFGKPHADLFIDDKGRQHIDWLTTTHIVDSFQGAGV
jgi:capsule biosynthesis phosphatase